MYYIASVSFGKDSLAMLIKLIEKGKPLDEVVFYDTGMEFSAIYKLRDKVKVLCKSKGILYTELSCPYDFMYKMFDKPVVKREEHSCAFCKHCKELSMSWSICNNPQSKYYKCHDECMGGLPYEKGCKKIELTQYTKFGYSWCGGMCRWGTTDKLKYIDSYAESKNAFVYVGIAADEPHRLLKERKSYKIFPLVDLGMKESDCLEYCYECDYHWLENGIELYDILDRVSCWCCSNKNLKELKNIYLYLPEYWGRLKYLQSKTDRPMKGKGKSVFDLEKRFQMEINLERSEKMTNTLKLKAAIVESGLNQEQIAEMLGMTVATFNYKVNNKSEFRASEIKKLCEILHINEVNAIFFAEEVE